MTGIRFLSRASDGSIVLVSCHPRDSATWHWSISLKRRAIFSNQPGRVHRAERRTHQWHDFYLLGFGWWLIVSRQDYHLPPQGEVR